MIYTIEPQRVTTMQAVIRIDQESVAALVADPAPLVADLRSLLKQWNTAAPSPVAKRRGKAGNGAAKPAPKKI